MLRAETLRARACTRGQNVQRLTQCEQVTRTGFDLLDFEVAWKRYLPSAPEKAATVATSETHDRRNVADVAASGPSADDDEEGLDL